MGAPPCPHWGSGPRWGRLFPPFLLPYKVQGEGDIRLTEQGQGGGWEGEAPLTQADTMKPLLVGLLLGTLLGAALGKKAAKVPLTQACPSPPEASLRAQAYLLFSPARKPHAVLRLLPW